ncbi:MAG: TetR/AcrR family transcriptional regulator [Myxococcales bacterium]|nr:TetR/AcrR family transcriptional regulator [Myxococcales bacterium]MDD9964972.1 TetR/AcrR family transcriptional regulator [Myxococcales bacterium]
MDDATSRDKKSVRGRVGRPRANPRPVEHPPEEEILSVAGRLFAQKGFAGTSTREIAEGAGLRQPSLFHYYPRKERILEALLERMGKQGLKVTAALQALPAPAAAKLYRLVHQDVLSICEAPDPVAAIMFLPEVQPPNFPDFWNANRQLQDFTRTLVSRGVQEGDLACEDVELAAHALQGMINGVLTWQPQTDEGDAGKIPRTVADLVLRALLADASKLETIRELGLSLPLIIPSGSA